MFIPGGIAEKNGGNGTKTREDNKMNQPIPFTWRCGTPACVGDIVEWGEIKPYVGEVYWSDYFKSYQVSVGTGLTLSKGTVDEFRFIRRGSDNNANAGELRDAPPFQHCVLSLFPGIGLLDMAFEEQGFCVVRGPDQLWGGDIKRFHPPANRFDGIIGGPPCQTFSQLRYLVEHNGYRIKAENLIPEFERCIQEAQPAWFLMENVRQAPIPIIAGYGTHSFLFDNRSCGGEQKRLRRITFGVKGGDVNFLKYLELQPFERIDSAPTVCASGCVKKSLQSKRIGCRVMGCKSADALKESLRLQGLPNDFLDHAPFTLAGKHKVVGNGVPLPMGRTLAKAVKSWTEKTP